MGLIFGQYLIFSVFFLFFLFCLELLTKLTAFKLLHLFSHFLVKNVPTNLKVKKFKQNKKESLNIFLLFPMTIQRSFKKMIAIYIFSVLLETLHIFKVTDVHQVTFIIINFIFCHKR